jgi:hypothetical protein
MNLAEMKQTGNFLYTTLGFCLILTVLSGCGSTVKNSSAKKPLPAPKPDWLTAKPAEDIYYIGIGHSIKDGTNNYVQEGKKSALEDLVSDIKVNVSSTSVLSQIDAGKDFQEKYQQIIQTKAADEIQEFELADSWQDDRNYWVYYRLSKERYKEIKDQEKRDAVTLALDFFTKARQSEQSGDLVQALGFYFQGFRAIEKYLAEPIELDFQGKSILLTNEIYSDMQELLDKIQVTVTPNENIVNRRIADSGLTAMAQATLKDSGKPVSGLPLSAAFGKGAGIVFPNYKTDATGQSKILITKISARDLEQTVVVKVDLVSYSGNDSTDVSSLVAQRMAVPNANILLKVQRPLVYVTASEKNFGDPKTNLQLANRLKNFITNSGFELTDDKSKAELWMDLNADSEKGAISGSIYIAYVTTVIRVVTLKDGKEIYATTIDRIKGYSLDYDRSSQEAYNKSGDTLEKEKMPELLNAILQ